MSNKSGKPEVSVRTSRMLAFLLGANLVILFIPRIGMIHDYFHVHPMLALLLSASGFGIMIWAFRTIYVTKQSSEK
ncbi:MAG: hypothetical protein SFU91_02330 [Chloroherpetonaceae bacterium]|nr:hypothetical protein [Chloroherpetonaceae bacterium]